MIQCKCELNIGGKNMCLYNYNKKESVLLTFTERMTREEIIIKIKGKSSEYVIKAINSLERKYGKILYKKRTKN